LKLHNFTIITLIGNLPGKTYLKQVFSSPFSLDVTRYSTDASNELIDLQCNSDLEDLNRRLSLENFWQEVGKSGKFPKVTEIVSKVLCMFGTTYLCEQFFSIMKCTKTEKRTRLLDRNLAASLRVSLNKNIKIDFNSLVEKKRCQRSSKK